MILDRSFNNLPVMSKISLADARISLWSTVSTNGSSDPLVVTALNDVLQRFYNSLDFDGKITADYELSVFIDSNGNQTVALPGRYIVAEYMHDVQGDVRIYNEFDKYKRDNCSDDSSHAEDLGDNFCTWFELNVTCRLFVKTAAAITGNAYFVINGLDGNGFPISETILLSSSGAASVNQYSRINSIRKDAISTDVLLFLIDPVSSVQTQIGQYDPNEVYPVVRRYYISRPTGIVSKICAKLRRRFIACVNNTDVVIPGNIPALKKGLLAINAENAGDLNRYNSLMESARRELDGELQQFIGEVNTGTIELSRYSVMSNLDNMP